MVEIVMRFLDIADDNMTPDLIKAAICSKAWPFEEARKLLARLKITGQNKVVFETGYSPSGLPHIGTFSEVLRTSMVRYAFHILTENQIPTRLIVFSDDMDGMRSVPENLPNREMLTSALGLPLTKIPDPFGTETSLGHHGNKALCDFLDSFDFDYEFISASEHYSTGQFDNQLILMLERYDDIMSIMLPTLREERRKTYSPFLPVHPITGVVMQVPIEWRDPTSGMIRWKDPSTGEKFETSVQSGGAKLQWKPDWALRWLALEVDYEMYGKDHIDNAKIAKSICKMLGGKPPEGLHYELFLDEKGEKISKSKGNGISVDDWLTYATRESLALFMFREPKVAKKLHIDLIPKSVEGYEQFIEAFSRQSLDQQLSNPVWHIHCGSPPAPEGTSKHRISFSMLLNLVSSSDVDRPETLWKFITRYDPNLSPTDHPRLDKMAKHAILYAREFVRPYRQFRTPTDAEKDMLMDLDSVLAGMHQNADADEIQTAVYDVGRRHFPEVKTSKHGSRTEISLEFFSALYQVLLGQETGPRFGSFIAAHGISETRDLIKTALARA